MIQRFSPSLRAVLVAASLTVLAAPALAQMPPPPPGAMGIMGRHMGRPSPDMERDMAEHRAQMAKDMHTILRLRADQEPAWQAFESAIAPPPPPSEMPDKPPVAGTALQHLDMMDKHRAEKLAKRTKMEAAVRAFYAALSPDQQQVFDALVRLRGMPGHHGHEGEGGPRKMMGPPPRP
jgi:periplasmic protein CpxP/Spy